MALPNVNNAQKNYLFILAILEDYATRSKFIQYANGVNVRFGVGPKDLINSTIKETPYMWVEDLGSTMIKADDRNGYSNIEHNVRIYIGDKEFTDNVNQNSAINNTKEELFALIAEITQHPYYLQNKIKLNDDDITIESEYEVDDDRIIRSYADLSFTVPYQYTYCSNPTDTIPLYTTDTIPYFNSATVSICSILQQCNILDSYATINYVDTGTASIWSYLSTFNPTSATPSLVEVLKAGNNAGTYSIIQDNSIISSDGNSQIDMGNGGGYLALTSDGQAYLEPYMYITNQNIFGYSLGVLGDQNFKISVGTPGVWVNNYLHGSSTLLDLNHSTAVLITTPQLQIVNGSEGLGKVLTSDASGIATWQSISIPAGLFEMSSGSASIISVKNALSGGTASAIYSISMGENNDVNSGGYNGAIIGGLNNTLNGGTGFIGGGQNISVGNVYGGAIAGFNNTLNGNYGFMAGGAYNTISNSSGLILCSSESKVIADGAAVINSTYATVSGTQSIILGVNNFIGTQSYTTYMTNLYTTGRGDITTYLSVGGRDIMVVNGITSSAIISAHSNENDTAELEIHRHSSSTNRGSTIYGARSRGTVGSETIVNSDDNLLDIIAVGFDGSDYAISSGIYFEVDGTASTNDMPGRIVFKTSPDGSQTPVEAFRLSNDKLAHFSGEVNFSDRVYHNVYTASVSSATYSIDCSLSNYQVLTFESDCQLSYINPKVGHYNIVCVATASRVLGLTTSGGWYAPAGIQLGFDNDVILMQMIYDGSRMIVSTYENLNEII